MSRLQSKFFNQYSGDDNLSQGHLMVMSVLFDMRKKSFKDTFFEMNKFPKKEPINFVKFLIMREPFNCSCGPIIS